jgi:DNA-binding transcriptional MerR regulator
MDDLLPIGRFARIAGLTIGALRHYDELDLLRPAEVDAATGYRRYRRDQLEMPLDEIRAVLATDDPAERKRLVEAHRRRGEARTFRLQYVLHVTGRLSAGKEPIVTETTAGRSSGPDFELDAEARRRLAADLYNHTWTFLEMPDRSPAQTDEMIHTAHASRYLWGTVGTEVNLARGEWLCSRVYAVLGRGEPALWHARRCVEINEAAGSGDWDIAGAYEAMARASAVAGDLPAARSWAENGRLACDEIAEDDDRELILGDLATIPLG